MNLTTHLSRFFVWYVFGIVVLVLGVHFSVNKGQRVSLENLYKEAFCKDCAAALDDFGAAPEFIGLTNWVNSEPLTLAELKGKVVLVDFWTYSCINCIRTFPHVTQWYEKYKDEGLVIVGVHTPEFVFEKNPANVKKAIDQYKIKYPVAQDNDYLTWQAYNNQYWPAHYLINKEGHIVYTHFGEGNYEITENTIRSLLHMPAIEMEDSSEKNQAKTPEIYFGTSRLEYLSKEKELPPNRFSLEGEWDLRSEFAELRSSGSIQLRFNAAKVHFVAESVEPVRAEVFIDNKKIRDLIIEASDLYTLFEAETAADRVIEIRFEQPGVKAFTFTFG